MWLDRVPSPLSTYYRDVSAPKSAQLAEVANSDNNESALSLCKAPEKDWTMWYPHVSYVFSPSCFTDTPFLSSTKNCKRIVKPQPNREGASDNVTTDVGLSVNVDTQGFENKFEEAELVVKKTEGEALMCHVVYHALKPTEFDHWFSYETRRPPQLYV